MDPCAFGAKNEEFTRVKDRAKNRASNCFETTQKRLLRRLLVTERRLFREYQNHPFLGTWLRFWLQFARNCHQDNFENFGKLCCLCRLYKLDMYICLTDQDGYLLSTLLGMLHYHSLSSQVSLLLDYCFPSLFSVTEWFKQLENFVLDF